MSSWQYPWNGGKGQIAKQEQKSQQKLIQDLHYSHETMCGMLSTLESLGLSLRDSHSQGYGKKMFKHYDRVNYSNKNTQELKSQLQTHIMLTRASFMTFSNQHQKEQWTYPSNYKKGDVIQFVNQQIQIFKKAKDDAAQKLARDILTLLNGQNSNLYIDKVDFAVKYSQSQKSKYKNQLLANGMFAAEKMDEVGNQVKNITDKNQLPAKLNKQNSNYKKGHKNEEMIGQAKDQKTYVLLCQFYSQLNNYYKKYKKDNNIVNQEIENLKRNGTIIEIKNQMLSQKQFNDLYQKRLDYGIKFTVQRLTIVKAQKVKLINSYSNGKNKYYFDAIQS